MQAVFAGVEVKNPASTVHRFPNTLKHPPNPQANGLGWTASDVAAGPGGV